MKKVSELVKAYILDQVRNPLMVLWTFSLVGAIFLFGFILNQDKTPSIVSSYAVFIAAYTSSVLLAMNISQDREKGIFRMVRTTRISKAEYLIAKFLIVNIAGFIFAGSMLTIGVLTTSMYPRPLFMALILLLTSLSHAGLGLLMAAYLDRDRDIQFVGSGLMMVMIIFSPVFYTLEQLPEAMSFVPRFVPLTYAVEAMRAVTVEGTAISEITLPMLLLSILSLISVAIGYRRLEF